MPAVELRLDPVAIWDVGAHTQVLEEARLLLLRVAERGQEEGLLEEAAEEVGGPVALRGELDVGVVARGARDVAVAARAEVAVQEVVAQDAAEVLVGVHAVAAVPVVDAERAKGPAAALAPAWGEELDAALLLRGAQLTHHARVVGGARPDHDVVAPHLDERDGLPGQGHGGHALVLPQHQRALVRLGEVAAAGVEVKRKGGWDGLVR